MQIDDVIDRLISQPVFLQLKQVVENINGWHDHESVYDHSLKTSRIAKEQINAPFITNADAKEKFLTFFDRDISGVKLSHIAILGALLHDCGKLIWYKEDGKEYPLNMHIPTAKDQTTAPAHEFYGGVFVAPQLLEPLDLSDEVKNYIATIVRLHSTLNNVPYLLSRKSWPLREFISEIKSKAEGYHIEALFNAYCDCYTAPAFVEAKPIVEKLFNDLVFYTPREYFIPA